MNRTFDRRIEFDPRSRNFPIRALIPKAAKPRGYTWGCDVWLDQGSEGACTGFAVAHEAAARPCVVPGITNAVARVIYKRAQELDEFPGEDYEGSSVLGAMKAGQERGWYPEYRWAFGVDDLILAVGYKGPADLGTNWYGGMLEPDKKGFVHADGLLVGGHSYLVRGVHVKKQYFTIRNSWGKAWGVNGDCYISFADMRRLLSERGEAAIPVKRAR